MSEATKPGQGFIAGTGHVSSQGEYQPTADVPLNEFLMEVQERVDVKIEDLVNTTRSPFYDIYRHALDGPAKRLRPALIYMTGDMYGVDRSQLDEYGMVAELVHTASLIFDDLPGQDNGKLRRGKEALHLRVGEGMAQIGALSMIFDGESRIAEIDAAAGLGGKLAKYVNRRMGSEGLCMGQAKDLGTFGSGSVTTEAALDEIAYLKTGLAIETSIGGAAIISGATNEQLKYLEDYSYYCGILFQLKDDLLEAGVTDGVALKTPGLDEENNKPSYVSVMGVEAATAKLDLHVQLAIEAIEGLSPNFNTVRFREILAYIRDRNGL